MHTATQQPQVHDALVAQAPEFFLDHEHISQHFLSLDKTATLFSVLGFMDSVETWAVQRFEDAGEEERQRLRAQLERLSEIIRHFSERIQPDNHVFVQVLAQMRASAAFYVLHYLTHYQLGFTTQLMSFCKLSAPHDVNASLTLRRMQALYRTRLLDRIFSKENEAYVMQHIIRTHDKQ